MCKQKHTHLETGDVNNASKNAMAANLEQSTKTHMSTHAMHSLSHNWRNCDTWFRVEFVRRDLSVYAEIPQTPRARHTQKPLRIYNPTWDISAINTCRPRPRLEFGSISRRVSVGGEKITREWLFWPFLSPRNREAETHGDATSTHRRSGVGGGKVGSTVAFEFRIPLRVFFQTVIAKWNKYKINDVNK